MIDLVPYELMLPYESIHPYDLGEFDEDGVVIPYGCLDILETATTALFDHGLVMADVCPLTWELDAEMLYDEENPPARFAPSYIRVYNLWSDFYGNGHLLEATILDLIRVYSPVAVTIPSLASYCAFDGNGVFLPTESDMITLNSPYLINALGKEEFLHEVLATGSGRDANGNFFIEIQESYGAAIGDGGFFQIATGYKFFRACVIMRL
ncbi:unnamed protein product [Arabis nemorensis]|uniref:Uncharacterized protein n=1 Tax=Arabis nemorensis TaxID=586526 RepID=A0A565B3X3_9BRAS|nr:unnamed protein product [Arabis nemorensis]